MASSCGGQGMDQEGCVGAELPGGGKGAGLGSRLVVSRHKMTPHVISASLECLGLWHLPQPHEPDLSMGLLPWTAWRGRTSPEHPGGTRQGAPQKLREPVSPQQLTVSPCCHKAKDRGPPTSPVAFLYLMDGYRVRGVRSLGTISPPASRPLDEGPAGSGGRWPSP